MEFHESLWPPDIILNHLVSYLLPHGGIGEHTLQNCSSGDGNWCR